MIEADGNRLRHIANGQVRTDTAAPLPRRLSALADQLEALITDHAPVAAAVEEVFVNKNPQSTLKLGQARGVVLMCAARAGIEVGEYAPSLVKKAVVGTGGAEKVQVHAMISRLLPGVKIAGPDAADALAVAITHAHHLASLRARPLA
jgi:crossover junction endodeoxyribonuclease RuvC